MRAHGEYIKTFSMDRRNQESPWKPRDKKRATYFGETKLTD